VDENQTTVYLAGVRECIQGKIGLMITSLTIVATPTPAIYTVKMTINSTDHDKRLDSERIGTACTKSV
jgi:hypothetical protein